MLVATSVRRSVLAAIVIAASVAGTAAATASVAVASQARPAATATHPGHILADGTDDTPWG